MELAASIMNRCSRRRASGVFAIGAVLCLGLAGAFPAQARFPAQAQELDWARSAGGTDSDVGLDITVDPRGNSYLAGIFQGIATFGAGEANQTELTSAGGRDIFVAKYAPKGTLLWARGAGGTDFDVGDDIATDRRGNSYATGLFSGTATFGAGEPNETELTTGFEDIFVAKYASDGTLLWARSAGSMDTGRGLGIATDRRGNSYVTGRFFLTATFGAGEANETELTAAGGFDAFVAKYASDGTLLWARSDGGTDFDGGFGIAVDRRGNSFVTGEFAGRATFGAGEANETELASSGESSEGDILADIFVARYRDVRGRRSRR